MKKILALFVLLAFVSASFAEDTNITELVREQPEAVSLELVKNWQLLAGFALIISGILVAIGYGIAIGFEMPELKAWAGTELKQIIANAVLILILFTVIGFLDILGMLIVNAIAPGGLHCDIGDNCLERVSVAYISDYISSAEGDMKNIARNAIKAGAWTGRSIGIYGTSIKAAGQMGISTPLAAYYILDVDRYHIIFQYYMGVVSSLYSQKFFIEQFSFKIGPVLLALGIVARSFFFSRRTGGLLIAISAGIMFFFPAMYVFDWATLDMVLEGDNTIVSEEFDCPSECLLAPPLAYYYNASDTSQLIKIQSTSDIYELFADTDEERETAEGLALGDVESAVGTQGSAEGQTVYSCYYGAAGDCPMSCRDLPYPHTSPTCADPDNQTACANLDERCKVTRYAVGGTETASDYPECPDECKIIPPLRPDCDVGDCLDSRFDCRVAKKEEADLGFPWRPSVDEHFEGSERCNDYASDCPASLVAEESCVWVMPETGSCDDVCAGCPSYCRVKNAVVENLAEDCFNESTGELLDVCADCSDTCKVDADEIAALNPTSPDCDDCPVEQRLLGADLPEELVTDGCAYELCPKEYRMYTQRSACEGCLLTPERFIYDPPINLECGDICKPEDNLPLKEAGSYAEIGADGLVGMAEIRNVSKLMIPGYLLPLFNIVATLVFIRTFSGMIGGDIEIPGISKLF